MARTQRVSTRSDVAKAPPPDNTPLATKNDGGAEIGTFPTVRNKGPLRIGAAKIMAFVLKDERRMLSGRSVTSALGLTGRGAGMARFLNAASLQPYISDKLRDALEDPVLFVVSPGLPLAMGYEAWVLPEICHTIIDAHDQNALHPSLAKTVDRARLLIRGFSTVGIIALIDEATGFQAERDREALQDLLAMYINPRLLPWAQTFGPDFYKEIFRLRGWKWESINNKRPRLVGKLTKQIIYDRISPELRKKLEEVNPVVKDGRRKNKHHQWLTEDYGQPALRMHREAVQALMRASRTWPGFLALLDRAYPRPGQQLTLGEGIDAAE